MKTSDDVTFRLGMFGRPREDSFAGLVLADRIIDLQGLRRRVVRLRSALSIASLLENWDANFAALQDAATRISNGTLAIDSHDVCDLEIRAPIEPRQIFCTIANYRSHIADTVRDAHCHPRLDERDCALCQDRASSAIAERLLTPPYVCLKLPTTLVGSGALLALPADAERADWELELGVVIGRAGRKVRRRDALSFVAGYTLVNDITVRDWVARPDLPRLGSDWLRSKNLPGSLPVGPYFVPAKFVPDPYAMRLTFRLNGEVMQDERVSDMLFDIETQIEYVSSYAQLLPGDLICTGTPAGCGIRYKRFLRPGDVMEGTAPGLGVLRTRCIEESPAS